MEPAVLLVRLLAGISQFHPLSKEYKRNGQQSKGLYSGTVLNSVVKMLFKDGMELTIQDL